MPRKRATELADDLGSEHAIEVHLDTLLAERGMTLTELSELVGITLVNLSVLKNGHARAIRFSTLGAICDALDCQPGDVLTWRGPGANRLGPGGWRYDSA
jgi:putative transcriptional regulator